MAKKAAKKKAVAKKKVAKKKSVTVKTEPMSAAETALLEMRQDMGIKEFADPLKKDIAELERDTIVLAKKKHENEVELSFHLYAIEERKIYAEHGWEKNDYYNDILQISYNKGNAMANNVRMLLEMGITNVKKLQGLSWGKVKELRGLIKNGVIKDRKDMDEWLKKCGIEGKNQLSLSDLQAAVRSAIAKKGKRELDKTRKKVSFDVEAYEMETLIAFEAIAKDELETDDRGRYYVMAAAEYSSVHVDAKDIVSHRHLGLANLKETAERIAPVSAVFFPTSPGVTQKDLGVIPVYSIYQGFVNKGDEQELKHCIASSEKEAKKFLGSKEVRIFDIFIAPSMAPKNPFKAPEDPDALKMTTSGPAKPAPKKKKVSKKKKDELSDEDVKKEIVKLVNDMGVSSTEFGKQKKITKARLTKSGEETTLNEAMLEWLREKKAGK